MADRLRVVQIIARMNVGGPAVLIANTMTGIDSQEFDMRLISGDCAPDEADYLFRNSLDLHEIRVPGLGRSVSPGTEIAVMRSVRNLLRDIQPHIVHTHTAKAGTLGRLAAFSGSIRARLIHTFHGHLLHGYFSPTLTRGISSLEKLLALGTDRLIAVSASVRDDLVQAGVGRLHQYEVIPPGVHLGPLPSESVARERLGLPKDARICLFLGRITKIKRPDRFAAAAHLIHERHPQTHFLVAGSGDLEPNLQAAMRDLPVTMLGWRTDIETVLAASNALVLTSDNEGTPISAIQAGLAGIPVVATRVGGLSSVVSDGQTGYLVDQNAKHIADAIIELWRHPELAIHMGSFARHKMDREFSLRAMIERHAQLYREVADS